MKTKINALLTEQTAEIQAMGHFLTESRKEKIDRVLANRTLNFPVVIEGLINHGNINAVMRTSEALGFSAFHIIETQQDRFKSANRSSQGADRWLQIQKWPSPRQAFKALRESGIQIACSALTPESVCFESMNLERPTAFVFGNERNGLSEWTLKNSDIIFKVPMVGMSQSLNVSVAAAITLHWARLRILQETPESWPLSEDQKIQLKHFYFQQSLPFHPKHLKHQKFKDLTGISDLLC